MRAAEDYEDYDSNKVHMCTFLMCIVKCIAMIYLQANKVELVPGYGVYITSKQLDLIKSNSNSATKLLRNLLMGFLRHKP